MYIWQILLVVCVAGIAVFTIFRPQGDAVARRLRFCMIWIIPYIFITVGLCALFAQGASVAAIFLVSAGACFLFFLKQDH